MNKYKRNPHKPSQLVLALMGRLFPDGANRTVIGDMEESFALKARQSGIFKARVWCWLQLLASAVSFLYGQWIWSLLMFSNYLKIALRNIRKQKGFTLINVLGLAAGIACSLSIYLFVSHEMSFDDYHKDLHRIYRVVLQSENSEEVFNYAKTCAPVTAVLKKDFPQIEAVAQILPLSKGIVRKNGRNFYEDQRFFADASLFEILTIPFVKGDMKTALMRPRTVVINERMSEKYFGDEDPLGQHLNVNGSDYEVTGVMKNAPENSHLNYRYFLSMKTIEDRYPFDAWFLSNMYVYVKLKPNTDALALANLVKPIAHTYAADRIEEGETVNHLLQPVKDIHLDTRFNEEPTPCMPMMTLYLLSGIGLLVLLIACINFVNLSTARSMKRAREVGIRKAVGATRPQLIQQFLGEAIVYIFAAMLAALILVQLLMPVINQISGKSFSVASLLHIHTLLFLLALLLFIGFAASAYPAWVMSAFRPVRNLGQKSVQGSGAGNLRRVLVVFQFAVSITLIIGTLVVFRQLDYMRNRNLGFSASQKLVLRVRIRANVTRNYPFIKNEFLKNPSIIGATMSSEIPGEDTDTWDTTRPDHPEERSQALNYLYVDTDFIQEFKLSTIAGRPFIATMSTDTNAAFILNRKGAEAYGWHIPEDAIGKRLECHHKGTVIGVVEDFHFYGLQNLIEPMVLMWRPERFERLILTLESKNLDETMAFVRSTYQKQFPNVPMESFFLDEAFNRQYLAEERLGKMISLWTIIGIGVACLGLFGLAAFSAEQKTKEIGIRKVLGCSSPGIVWMLIREFMKWVLMANIIAWPVSWLVMGQWLSAFAFRISLGAGLFIFSSLLAFVIAFVSVSWQAMAAARLNPVESLKYE